MGLTLVIVESPAKGKTIGRYLGPDYRIAASVGHIRDLPSSSMGVDIENDFKPRYINMKGKDKVIRELKERAKNADNVLIATDPDREGEAIAWHLANILKIDPASACRITFNAITEKSVKEAVANPRPIDMELVDAQQARRILDRLVGYELSPLLWKKVRTGLSAGRVQSVAVRMIVDREREIEAFVPEEYWTISLLLANKNDEQFTARYQGILNNANKLEKVRLLNKEMADKVLANIKGQELTVHSIKKGSRKRQPGAPFTTSTLQQEAGRRLGFTSRRTMSVAQQLYEGLDLKGIGQTALVTYIRTDSVRVDPEATASARQMIETEYGKDYLPKSARTFKNKNASQDAHEAIRPAHFEYSPASLRDQLSNDQYRLYKLIWERFIASQMAPAEIDTLTVDTVAAGELFRSQGERVTFSGFLRAYEDVTVDKDELQDEDAAGEDGKEQIPQLEEGEKLLNKKTTPEQKFTKPPPRYTEASLIKAMEEEGIGRPSTYAPTISTILTRNYIEKEQRQLKPTSLGIVITDLLMENIEKVVDLKFTAAMENELDTVEAGEKNWVDVLKGFYPDFHEAVMKAEENVERVKLPVVETGEICPKDGGKLVIKEGRYGKFIACQNFPECDYTASIEEKVDAHCPLCHSNIVGRKSRRGSLFYVCDKKGNDPDCKFISWDLPIDNSACEVCGSYMVLKKYRGSTFKRCSNQDCETNAKYQRKKTGKTGHKTSGEAGEADEPEKQASSSTTTAKKTVTKKSAASKKTSTSKKATSSTKGASKKSKVAENSNKTDTSKEDNNK